MPTTEPPSTRRAPEPAGESPRGCREREMEKICGADGRDGGDLGTGSAQGTSTFLELKEQLGNALSPRVSFRQSCSWTGWSLQIPLSLVPGDLGTSQETGLEKTPWVGQRGPEEWPCPGDKHPAAHAGHCWLAQAVCPRLGAHSPSTPFPTHSLQP